MRERKTEREVGRERKVRGREGIEIIWIKGGKTI